MNGLTNKEAAILSELVYAKQFFIDRSDASKLRGLTLYDIFFDNGEVSQSIASLNPDIAMHLTNNYDHYAEVLNKYQLVETTSTIVDGSGAPIKYNLLGEDSYSGIVLTEVSNPTNAVFVSRGTATKMDGLQDVALGAGFTPAYMQDAHKFYHDVLEQQKYPEYRRTNLGVAKDNISTAGHSLGGTAAEAIALAALANGANVNTAQTFEGYGVDQLLSSPVSFVDDIFGSLADTTMSIADVRSHLETLSNLDISQISDVSAIGQSIKDAASSALTNLDNLISSTPDIVLESSTKLIALNSDIQALFDSDVANIKLEYLEHKDQLIPISEAFIREGDPVASYMGNHVDIDPVYLATDGAVLEAHSINNFLFDTYNPDGSLKHNGDIGELNDATVNNHFSKEYLDKLSDLTEEIETIDAIQETSDSISTVETIQQLDAISQGIDLEERFQKDIDKFEKVFGRYSNGDFIIGEIDSKFIEDFDAEVYSVSNQKSLVEEYFKQDLNSLEKQISEADNDISDMPGTETLELLQKHKDKYELVKELEQAKLDYVQNLPDEIAEFESALVEYYGEDLDEKTEARLDSFKELLKDPNIRDIDEVATYDHIVIESIIESLADGYVQPLEDRAQSLSNSIEQLNTEINAISEQLNSEDNQDVNLSVQLLKRQQEKIALAKELSNNTNVFNQEFANVSNILGTEGYEIELLDKIAQEYLDAAKIDNATELLNEGQNDLLDIADNLADINRSSQQAQVFRGDPLTFDLDGDGIETVSVDDGVLFDHQSTGVKEGTGWVSADDGLLVRDLDGNGTIDSGRELFGDNTLKADGTKAAHGFEALAELDSNADGIIDANDTEFENLQVWQDTNSDGISQANELKNLSQVGVSSIDLSHQSINRATDGGVISDISTFTKIDGATAEIGNLFLDKEPARSEFTDEVAISGEILSTGIDIRGIGAVRNLSQAASLNSDLANILVEVSANPVAGLQTESIVKEWVKSAKFSDTLNLEKIVLADGTSFKFNISENTRSKLEQIQTLETFTGNKIIQTKVDGNQLTMTYGSVSMSYNITAGQENVLSDSVFTNSWNTINRTRAINIDQITNGYNSIVSSVDKSLFSQTIYQELLSQLGFNYDDVSGDISVDFTNLNEFLSNSVNEQLSNSMFLLEKVKNYTESILVELGWNYDDFFKQIVVDTIVPNISDIDLTVSQANEINRHNIEIDGRLLEVIGATNTANTAGLYQGTKDKYILGKANDESIVLSSDRSIVEAGGGNDTIVGYKESIVKYNLGDGFDTLKLSSTSKILFGDGISQDSLSFSRSNDGKNLIINVDNDPTQGVEVIDFYHLKRNPTIEFSDGYAIQRDSEVFNLPIIGTDGDDDIVLSSIYDNYVEVGKGNDHISYGQTNDYANDTFKYNLGDGFDTINTGSNSLAASVKNSDKVVFGEGVSQKDLGFKREFNDLIINVKGDINQGLKIEGFFSKSAYYQTQLDTFEFADGSVLTKNSEVFNLAILGTDDNNNIYTSLKDDVIIAGKGDDSIYDSDRGAGYYDGGYYNSSEDKSVDTIIYNLGDGFDTIFSQVSHQEARDTLAFGEGISLDNLSFARKGNELTININNDPSQGLRITNFFSSSRIKDIRLVDGTVLDRNSEQINSAIIGTESNDTIYTGISNDVIEAGEGDDVITGGQGDDIIHGELGNNTIHYDLGDGFDTIAGAKENITNQTDRIVFGENISQNDVQYLQRNEDLFVQVGSDTEQGLLIKKFYATDGNQTKVTGFEFSDGSFKSIDDVQPITLGTDASETITGTNDAVDVVYAGAGDDIVYLGSGDDIADAGDGDDIVKALNGGNNTIEGGAGDDTIEVGAGDDVITGGQGDDVIFGGEGSDTYKYSQGDGNDTLDVSSNDGTMDTLELTDIDHDAINLSRAGEDLLIKFASDPLGSVIVDDYFSSQYTNQGLEIDASDGFALDLSANSNKIAELLAAAGADDIDMDGGGVDGAQTTTKLSSSELADLWLPKESNEF
ncbi:calcium-binding protein [Francisella philomiragia]|uniref:calcium-binding protein n=1 Tax=Francisella philomiragia TaxID=28110 RepID=UPI001B8D465C|nr:calcium-binding protein [Francisella philomiragia]QUE31651.1 hypothetical protein IMS64_01180 [Francisella philomiragia]